MIWCTVAVSTLAWNKQIWLKMKKLLLVGLYYNVTLNQTTYHSARGRLHVGNQKKIASKVQVAII